EAAPQLVALGRRQEALEPVVPLDLVAVPAGEAEQERVAVGDAAGGVEEHRRQLHVLDEDPKVLGVLQGGEQLAAAIGAGGFGHSGSVRSKERRRILARGAPAGLSGPARWRRQAFSGFTHSQWPPRSSRASTRATKSEVPPGPSPVGSPSH